MYNIGKPSCQPTHNPITEAAIATPNTRPNPSAPQQGDRDNNRNSRDNAGSSQTRINHRIRASEVRCLRPDGSQMGILPFNEALRLAENAGLDLVEVNPNASPPVCRIMDYGKFKYEEDRRKKEAKKRQNKTIIKEIKFHANVDENDYQVKLRNIRSFLAEGDKVRITLQFRGRENAHKEIGEDVIARLKDDIKGFGNIEQEPKLMGRTISGLIGPVKN